MVFEEYCWGDVLANPGRNSLAVSAYNAGCEAAMHGKSMVQDGLEPQYSLRAYWVAGWRCTRMTVIAGACQGDIPDPVTRDSVLESLRRQRSDSIKKRIGIAGLGYAIKPA